MEKTIDASDLQNNAFAATQGYHNLVQGLQTAIQVERGSKVNWNGDSYDPMIKMAQR